VKKFGRAGEGPGEFRNPPVRLDIVTEGLRITEMYGWSHSFYTMDGRFLYKEELDSTKKYIGKWELREFPATEAIAKQYRLGKQECLMGSFYGETGLDLHYSSFVFDSLADGTFFFVKRRGAIQVYSAECQLLEEVEFGLARFSRQPEFNKLFTQISHSMYRQPVRRYYSRHQRTGESRFGSFGRIWS
jgi:hypothetical protein